MAGTEVDLDQWRGVDEGWGRRAADFASLGEPANCREYVALHQHLGVGPGDRLLDVACGAGLAVELAAARGAMLRRYRRLAPAGRRCARPVSRADIRVGDMHALPWDDGSFDVVTSFRGIWGTTPARAGRGPPGAAARRPHGPDGLGPYQGLARGLGARAVHAGRRAQGRQPGRDGVPRPSGRGRGAPRPLGVRGRSPRASPVRVGVRRSRDVCPALASSGPAYEAIQTVGEDAFTAYAVEVARRTGARRASAARRDQGGRVPRPQAGVTTPVTGRSRAGRGGGTGSQLPQEPARPRGRGAASPRTSRNSAS